MPVALGNSWNLVSRERHQFILTKTDIDFWYKYLLPLLRVPLLAPLVKGSKSESKTRCGKWDMWTANIKHYLNTDVQGTSLLALVPPLYDIWFISMKPHMAPCWTKGSLSLKKETPGTWTPLIKSFATPCGTDSSAEVTYASWGSRYPQGKDHSSGKSSVTETLDSRTERWNQAWVHSTSPRGPLEAFWLPMPANLDPKYPQKNGAYTGVQNKSFPGPEQDGHPLLSGSYANRPSQKDMEAISPRHRVREGWPSASPRGCLLLQGEDRGGEFTTCCLCLFLFQLRL